MLRTATCFFLLLCAVIPGESRSKHRSRHAAQGTSFDYYLFALSWSPEYCHGHATDQQCSSSKHYGFVVHGLWPEYKSGGGPQNCGMQLGLADPSSLLDIMPSLHLIQHEWITHGTCSGLDAQTYFGNIRKAFTMTKIPSQFAKTDQQLTLSPLQIEKSFQQSNPGLPQGGIQVACPSNYLQAVEICLNKELHYIACPTVRDCRAQSVKIPPIP